MYKTTFTWLFFEDRDTYISYYLLQCLWCNKWPHLPCRVFKYPQPRGVVNWTKQIKQLFIVQFKKWDTDRVLLHVLHWEQAQWRCTGKPPLMWRALTLQWVYVINHTCSIARPLQVQSPTCASSCSKSWCRDLGIIPDRGSFMNGMPK